MLDHTPTEVIRCTFFAGGARDTIPEGPSELFHDWNTFAQYIDDEAAIAPVAPKGGGRGHLAGCTYRVGTQADIDAINEHRARKGEDPLWPDAERAILTVGYRHKSLVDTAYVLVLDYDLTPLAPPDWRPESWPCELLAYSSSSYHPVTCPGAWRVFLRLAEPIPAADYDRVKAELEELLPANAALRWAGQPAFLPTRRTADVEVQVVRVPGPPLDWRALLAAAPPRAPAPPRAETPCAPRQDASNDAVVVDLLAGIWGATTGHRAFGALGGIMYRKGIALDRALAIAEAVNDRAQNPHSDPAGRIEEAYEEAHELGIPKLLEALTLGLDVVKAGGVHGLLNTALHYLDDSVRAAAPVVAHILPAPGTALARAVTGNSNIDIEMSHEDRLSTWNAFLHRNAKGEVKNIVFNTLFTFDNHPEWRGMFGWDDFTQQVVFLRAPELPELAALGLAAGDVFDEDRHVTGLQAWFGKQAHEPTPAQMIAAVHTIAQQRPFHAVRAYLEGLRGQWDGQPRNLVEYLGAELTPYHAAVCAKWMISAVARAMVPGSKSDSMLILEGRQGHLKSTAIRCLCPDVRWFFEVASREVGSKDFMQDMRGKWLCEIPEVDQLTLSRDESELKALLTRQSDNYRASYARKSRDYPRQLVFAATTNKTDYLRDETGNRRYWPVACGVTGPILDALICDDRDQLWAQAMWEYETGMAARAAGGTECVWWLDPEEKVLAEEEQLARLEEDPWLSAVQGWLEDHPELTGAGGEGFLAADLLGQLPGGKPVAELEQRDLNRLGKALRRLGYENRRSMRGTSKVRLWFKA